jgi:wyosine [tRNA(Phe)-imidazoG37] synthetase (radical SAM superfamily)
MIAFGPVPSRRFGRSLGVNNIPPNRCSYSCVYCQLGPTRAMRVRRRPFLRVQELVSAVGDRVEACRARGEPVDYLTFVPDGEPTLDLLLGAAIRGLEPLGIRIAVITNGSLLWRPDVRADLSEADVVSVKVDTTAPETWHAINRPGRQLRLHAILQGLRTFARDFSGEVWTETMLVDGMNDAADGAAKLADFLGEVSPARAYLAVPTRPPAVARVRPASAEALARIRGIFRERLKRVEVLSRPEEGAFGHGEDPAEDLLAILAVHPMPETVARRYLEEAGTDPAVLDELLDGDRIVRVGYRGGTFVTRMCGGWRMGRSP